MSAATAVNNYEYLDILDRAWTQGALARLSPNTVCDVGCASFWYAAALQAFFSPRELIGVEVEGHRLFRDGRTRIDYASGYLTDLPNARFVVQDYVCYRTQADIITAWFPFVTPAAILAWRLPLSLLRPESLFQQICHNLSPDGLFIMVNHGAAEAEVAARLCSAAGMHRDFQSADVGVLSSHRGRPALLSVWRRA